MTVRRSRKSASVATQAAELALAAPQVVAHRVARMALAGATPSERDRKEFERMVTEKGQAFFESWGAMTLQAIRANQALAVSLFQSFWMPCPGSLLSAGSIATQVQGAALGVIGKGLEPVHRKAVANARRLSRTKLR
ncbi:polyhydroxyalkanoate granule-associated phasin [Ideonella oryzae]|uniref:Phasin domain-containing protein n=1 Tax=Ideonella oryzae TaxID=2937441 RepID=A0ABT1BR86_9BURK|nr:polyhydroxyalkanoate granule-associated phasin [Ideonella oryzae]MCO5978755.1 hypothetical protein [Ideonella oryzae]